MLKNKSTRKFQIAIVAIVASLTMHSASWAATYYVDATGGNDNKSGLSPEEAWKTISKVNKSQFNPGDQILFERGEIWHERLNPPSSGSAGNPIMFGAYGIGDDPIISAADLVSTWSSEGGNKWSFTLTTDPIAVHFDNVYGTEQASNCPDNVDSENEWCWVNNTLYVYATEDPAADYTDPGMNATIRGQAAWWANKDYLTFENIYFQHGYNGALATTSAIGITFNNCEAAYAIRDGFMVTNSSSAVFTDCISHDNERHGIFIYDDNSGNAAVIGGTFYNNDNAANWGAGVQINRSNNILVEGIVSYDNFYGLKMFSQSDPSSGGFLQNNTLYNNVVGIDTDASVFNVDVRSNTMYGNSLYGIIVEQVGYDKGNSGIKVYNNLVYNNGDIYSTNIHVQNIDGAEIYSNVIYGGGGSGIRVYTNGINTKIYNNTIYNVGNKGIYIYDAIGCIVKNNIIDTATWHVIWVNANSIKNFVADNNVYNESGNKWKWGGVNYSYADWKINSSQDANSYNLDPLMTDPANGDFALLSNSPMIDAGSDVGLLRDIVGNGLCGSAWDIGAFEWQKVRFPKNFRIKFSF